VKKIIVTIIIIILLGISFSVIFVCQKASLAKKEKYPNVNCIELQKEYNNRADSWMRDAILDFKVN